MCSVLNMPFVRCMLSAQLSIVDVATLKRHSKALADKKTYIWDCKSVPRQS